MNKTFLKRALACFMLLVLTVCSACGYLPSREEQLGIVQPQQNTIEEQPASAPTVEEVPEVKGMDPINVIISEVMASNKATLAMPDGSFPDWVELCNIGSESADLEGYRLSCGGSDWYLPAVSIAPGEYLLAICDGADSAENGIYHAGFTVPKEGAQLAILLADGTTVSSFSYQNAEEDVSYINCGDGTAEPCSFPTPGYENSHEGYASFQNSLSCESQLVIYEAVVYNPGYMSQRGEYFDFVELKNISSSPVNLNDYYLSDKGSDRALFQLPDYSLAPGSSYFVYCTDDEDAVINGGVRAPFGLSAQKETLYLSRSDGSLCDYCALHDIPIGGSYGRIDGENGFFYFKEATPQSINANGFRSISAAPVVLEGTDGVFNGVDSVSVSLGGEGTIYYTTDGSMPTENSSLYTGPLSFSQTSVLRAVSIVPGTLPGKTLDLSFVINENHSLPVISIVMEPEEFKGSQGFYNNYSQDWEKICSAIFFEEGKSFHIHCGIKLHGATSKKAQEKKSVKLCFRTRYDGDLKYDLFDDGLTDYASILVRAAQESSFSSWIRDSVLHDAAQISFPELPSQKSKFSILYVNGQYWGLYCIREAHSEAHFANRFGYDEDDITMIRRDWDQHKSVRDLFNYILSSDMSNPENYAYVREHLDVDSLIGWTIMQSYCGNMDAYPGNTRFYYSASEDYTRIALVDLDLGFFETWRDYSDLMDQGFVYTNLFLCLMNNADFKQLYFEKLASSLTGSLSNAEILASVDRYAALIGPEIDRDGEKWYYQRTSWEREVNGIRNFVNEGVGRARIIASTVKQYNGATNEIYNSLFSEVK